MSKRPELPKKPSTATVPPKQHTLFYDTAKEKAYEEEPPYFKDIRTSIPGVVYDFTVSQWSDGNISFTNSDSTLKEHEEESSVPSIILKPTVDTVDAEVSPESPKAIQSPSIVSSRNASSMLANYTPVNKS